MSRFALKRALGFRLWRNRTVKIPKCKLKDGLTHCERNIKDLIGDAYTLLEKGGSDWRAAALLIFAFEELAKYHELKKAERSATSDTVEVKSLLFTNHRYKHGIAKDLVPKGTTIFTPRDFLHKHHPDFCPTEPVEVSPSQRTMFLFVDWDEKQKQWTWGAPVLRDEFMIFTKAIQDALEKEKSAS